MQHPDQNTCKHTSETDACNIHLKYLQYVQHPDLLFATSIRNNLQHTSKIYETHETYAYNMRFQRSATSPYCLGEWRLLSACGAHRRQRPGDGPAVTAARRSRRQRPHDSKRESDPLGSHSCWPCHAGPLVIGAVGTAPPCQGPLGPPRRSPFTPKPLLTLRLPHRRAETLARTEERGSE
jgi:hypothetical protein